MGNKLLLVGGGGHCQSVLDSVRSFGYFDTIGIINKEEPVSPNELVIGTDADLPGLFAEGWHHAFISVGSIENTAVRRRLYKLLKEIGFTCPVIIDPTAIIAQNAVIGEGTFIGKRAVVNEGAEVGICSIINTGAIVEHNCTVGNFSHISSGAVLCGQVSVGDDTLVGAASVLRQNVEIGKNVVIGAGSVVVKNIMNDVEAYGNPAKVVTMR